MPILTPRLAIGRLMTLVAVSAGVLAQYQILEWPAKEVLRPTWIIPLIAMMAMTPVRFAHLSRWVVIARWVIAFWSLSILVLFQVTFAVASVVESSQPGPPAMGPIVRFLEQLVFWSGVLAMVMTLFGLYLPLIAPDRSGLNHRHWNLQLIPVLLFAPVWLAVIGRLYWEPAGAFWYLVDWESSIWMHSDRLIDPSLLSPSVGLR